MQHRPEHFTLDVRDMADFDKTWRNECASCGGFAKRALRDIVSAAPHRLDVGVDRVSRLAGDDWTDVDRKSPRIANLQLGNRALQHCEYPIRHIVLQAKDA